MKQIKAHDYKDIYAGLGIDLNKLGCVMLDVKPTKMMVNVGKENIIKQYFAKDKSRFWINGWVCDKTPHITLLYGLLYPAQDFAPQIAELLKDWKLPEVEIESVGYFDSPFPDEPYYCIVAHIKVSEDLLEGHQRMEFLPHVNTFAGYKPHITLGYIPKDEGEEYRDFIVSRSENGLAGIKMEVSPIINLGGDK